ncbi:hypothetical protein ZWY2020_001030 [Hordeum vulgare]|nr:hypothetical protein ZWY2020_001030 [Hordeum vulgare]
MATSLRRPAGRLDGLVSSAAEAQAGFRLHLHRAAAHRQLRPQGLRRGGLVILSGAHSIGVGHCSSFTGRLTAPPGRSTRPTATCSTTSAAGRQPRRRQQRPRRDYETVARFMPGFTSRVRKISDVLDNTFYNNLARIVSFNSDWQLMTHTEARGHVHEYADNATLWDGDFAESLLKLSKLSMPAGNKAGSGKVQHRQPPSPLNKSCNTSVHAYAYQPKLCPWQCVFNNLVFFWFYPFF